MAANIPNGAAEPAAFAPVVAAAPAVVPATFPYASTSDTVDGSDTASRSPLPRRGERHEETMRGRTLAGVPLEPAVAWSLTSPRSHSDTPRAMPNASATGVAPGRESIAASANPPWPAHAAALPPLVDSLAPAARAAAYAREAVAELLPARVSAAVHDEVERAVARAETARRAQAADPAPPPAIRAVDIDDHTAGLLLGRMRALLREERFRHGQLR